MSAHYIHLKSLDYLVSCNILGVTETHLSSNEAAFDLNTHHFLHHSTTHGVGLYIKQDLEYNIIYKSQNNQALCIQARLPQIQDLLIVVLYRPPGRMDNFLSDLQGLLNKIEITKYPQAIIMGDFNIDSNTNSYNELIHLMQTYSLQQHVKEATHSKGGTLDHIYTKQDSAVAHTSPVFFTDHFLTWVTVKE